MKDWSRGYSFFLRSWFLIFLSTYTFQIAFGAQLTSREKEDSLNHWIKYALDSFYYKPDATLKVSEKALGLSLEVGDSFKIFRSLNLMGLSYWVKSEYKEAFSCYWKAMEVANSLPQTRPKFLINNNISILYKDFGFYDKSLEYLKKARQFAAEDRERQLAYFNFAATKRMLHAYDTALIYLDSVLDIGDTIHEEIKGIRAFAQIKKAANLVALEKFVEAKSMLNVNLQRIIELKNPYFHCMHLEVMGKLHLHNGEYNLALKYLHDGLVLTNENNFRGYEIEIHNYLADCYKLMGNKDKENNHLRKYNELVSIYFGVKENLEIFEIRNVYQKYREESERKIQEKNIENLKREKKPLYYSLLVFP